MCLEHRPTLAVTEMGGDKPKKTTSFNVENVVLYNCFAGFLLLVVTLFAGAFGFMFDRSLHKAMRPGGDLEVEIRRSVNEGNDDLEKRLIRIETIVLEIRDQ